MRTTPLYTVATTVLDGSGNGTVLCGPQVTGESWNATSISVSVATNAHESIASVSVNGQTIDATTWGSTGDSTDSASAITLYPGQLITVAWTGGDHGSTATAVITGTRQIS